MLRTSEAFHNAKMLKLYGWEKKWQGEIAKLYEEEREISQD